MANIVLLLFADLFSNNLLFILDFFGLCEEHALKLSSFTAIFQVLLVIGFAYNNVPDIKKIFEVYMATDYKEYRFQLKQEVKATKKKIRDIRADLCQKEKAKDYFDLYAFQRKIHELEDNIKGKKNQLLLNNSHSFLLLGFYCFVILTGCGLEEIIKEGREYLRFKNALLFFNPLMMAYMINHYQHNSLKIKDSLFHHVAFIAFLLLIAFTCCFLIDQTANILFIILSTFCILLFPFICIFVTYLQLRGSRVKPDFLNEMSSIERKMLNEFKI